jgi:hypothetical protein
VTTGTGENVKAEWEARNNALEKVLKETRLAQTSSAELHEQEMEAQKKEYAELQQRVFAISFMKRIVHHSKCFHSVPSSSKAV